ncbi:MAG TPA: hypothetical protein VGZ23_06850 [bacterium]|nr:hypothetical protein [bacterium]
MPQDRETYWDLIEVERQLRNALSIVREAEHLAPDRTSIRVEVSKIADALTDAVALAAASRRRALEELSESALVSAAD